jgi:DHA3 family macrolide efflux protein-like MFS transporter
VTEHFSGIAWHLGILEAGFGIGVLAGGLLLSVWGGFKRRTTTSLIGLAGIGLGILIVGLSPATLFPLAVAGMVVVGVMSSLCNGPITAILQAIVEPSMQGRVFTLVGSASAAMMPLGLAVSGPLADVIGVRTCFVIGGLITLLAGVAAFFVPAVVNIEEDREKHAPAGESLPASMTNPIMEPVESA